MEVRTNEGPSSEAVISKLTDASLYTVGESLPADWSARATRQGDGLASPPTSDWLIFFVVHFLGGRFLIGLSRGGRGLLSPFL